MIPFFTAPNLATTQVRQEAPWDFSPSEQARATLAGMPKAQRRATVLRASTQWSVYSPVRGLNAAACVSTENPAIAARGFVADYDVRQSVEAVVGFVNQIPAPFLPQFLEVTLGGKARLVWVFAEEIPCPDSAFLTRLWREMAKRGGWETALPGFDAASFKPAERWTNGGIWYELTAQPLPQDVVVGCAVEAGKALSAARQEIPLEKISAEIALRWPGRWQGDFKLDAVGVRFWDSSADAPAGCQVKPDGMLCFTGNVPFIKWRDLFGPAWYDQHATLHMASCVEDIFFDGRQYWELNGGHWDSYNRQDILLHLAGRGLSTTKAKGQVVADAEAGLLHIQRSARVEGAAPLVNMRPGLVEIHGKRFLNIARLNPVRPCQGPANAGDFPWIWTFLTGLFADDHADGMPLDTFLAWLQRSYRSVLDYTPRMGQVVFLCGPRSAGKTLSVIRIITPLLGGQHQNPYSYMVGDTSFTDELFGSYVWAINDEEAPRGDAQRQKFLARLKSTAVNPEHTFHPKFCNKLTVRWQGRMIVTLNDDPTSVGILPEVNESTVDKMMFFRVVPYAGVFPPNEVLEPLIEKELPAFAEFLLHGYEAPESVLDDGRMGVRSYFNPEILGMARHQLPSHNLQELIAKWIRVGAHWDEAGKVTEWIGSATDLISEISVCEPLRRLADEWTVMSLAKRLTDLSRIPTSGVSYVPGSDRTFRILRNPPSR